MLEMNSLGKALIVFGAILIAFGAMVILGGKISWIGRLPGDIFIQKKGCTLIFPITTSILISILLSLLLMIFTKR